MSLLAPRKIKHRKHHKGSVRGKAGAGTEMAYGSYGLRVMESRWLTARQIEAARRAMTRYVQRTGKIWIRAFPDKPVTKKGSEVPMGSGKGAVDHYVAVVKRGRMILEMDGIEKDVAEKALRLAAGKLPVKAEFVEKKGSF